MQFIILLCISLFFSCKDEVPSELIQNSEQSKESSKVTILNSSSKKDIESFVKSYADQNSLLFIKNEKYLSRSIKYSLIHLQLDGKKNSGLLLSVILKQCNCSLDFIFLFIFQKNRNNKLELICNFEDTEKHPYLKFGKIDIDNDSIDEFYFQKDISGNGYTDIYYSLFKIKERNCQQIFEEPIFRSRFFDIFENTIAFQNTGQDTKILKYNSKVADLSCFRDPEKPCQHYKKISASFQFDKEKYILIENKEAENYRNYFIPVYNKANYP